MNLKEYIARLEKLTLTEGPYSQYVGAFARPDMDYVGLAYKRNPTKRPKDWPYDQDTGAGKTYGNPRNIGYDRGSGAHEPSRNIPTPINTVHSAWEEEGDNRSEFEEAAGTPMNFAISGGKGGSTTVGVSGASGARGWAGNPIRDWDEDEDDKLNWAGSIENEEVEPEPDEPEEMIQSSDFPSVLVKVVGAGFGMGLGKTNPSGRGFMNGWTEDCEIHADKNKKHTLEWLVKMIRS